jgi:ribosomal protein S1
MKVQQVKNKMAHMEKLVADNEQLVELPRVGDVVMGHIIDKAKNAMYVDLGAIGVGVIYGKDLFDDQETFKTAKIGDAIEASIQDFDNEDDLIELSIKDATREKSWEKLNGKLESGEGVETEILDANKGGLIVRINGVMGFLPVSQLGPDHYPRVEGGDKTKIFSRLKEYVGEKFKVKIIHADKDEEKLIVSEKAIITDELSGILDTIKEGDVIKGVVTGIVDFGVFIKFEKDNQELEGLVHISELAWQRVDNPNDFVEVGQKIEAKIISVEGLKISLSIKQMKEDPWIKAGDKYKVGSNVMGEVIKTTAYGGFVQVGKDLNGLLHISEIPLKDGEMVQDCIKVGDKKKFRIISFEPKDHRLGLSLLKPEKEKKESAKKTENSSASKKKKIDE